MMSLSGTSSRHSCDSPEWYTPSPFIEAAREVMRGIDLDPASHEEANRTVKATTFYTEEENGLRQPWKGRVFLNPPGGDGLVPRFWDRLVKQFQGDDDNRVTQAIWIGYSLEQLQTLQRGSRIQCSPLDFPICITKARIAFVENEAKKAARIVKLLKEGEAANAPERKRKIAASIRAGKEPPNSPSHSNYITYLGPNRDHFLQVFSQFGGVRI